MLEGRRNHRYEPIDMPALPPQARRFLYAVNLPYQMKIARILDEEGGTFRLEYDNHRDHKQNTRLDALTCYRVRFSDPPETASIRERG